MSQVAVVLVNYFGAEDCKNALTSLSASSCKPFVVIVNNSPDDTELSSVLAAYPECFCIEAGENLGFGAANNLAMDWLLKQTSVQYILLLNNDAIVERDAIFHMVKTLKQRLDVGVVTPKIVMAEGNDRLWYGGGEINWWRGGATVDGYLGDSNSGRAICSREVSFATGCAMCFRREAVEALGGFDPRYFMYEEDVELSLRLLSLGEWKIYYQHEAIVRHRGQGSHRQEGEAFIPIVAAKNPNLSFFIFHTVRNRILCMARHANGPRMLRFAFGFPLYFLKLAITYALARRWDAILAMIKAVREALHLLYSGESR